LAALTEQASQEIQELRSEMGEIQADVKFTLKALNIPQGTSIIERF
jgi:hypothetical protein